MEEERYRGLVLNPQFAVMAQQPKTTKTAIIHLLSRFWAAASFEHDLKGKL